MLHFARQVISRQQVGLDQNLKAVADPDDRFARVHEIMQRVAEPAHELIRENPASRYVIAITEATGNRENLIVVKRPGALENAVEMHAFRCRARQLEQAKRIASPAGSPLLLPFEFSTEPVPAGDAERLFDALVNAA